MGLCLHSGDARVDLPSATMSLIAGRDGEGLSVNPCLELFNQDDSGRNTEGFEVAFPTGLEMVPRLLSCSDFAFGTPFSHRLRRSLPSSEILMISVAEATILTGCR